MKLLWWRDAYDSSTADCSTVLVWCRQFLCSVLIAHWNGNVVILTKFSSLAATKIVRMTIFDAASDDNFVKMMTFSFHCRQIHCPKGCARRLQKSLHPRNGWKMPVVDTTYDLCVKGRYIGHGLEIAPGSILWGVISFPCPVYITEIIIQTSRDNRNA